MTLMHATRKHITIGREDLHYMQAGSGPRLLLAFPGYGHDAQSLLLFAPELQHMYTCLFFDMPHHGNSKWSAGAAFTKPMLTETCKLLMAMHNVNTVSLLGYSMGGRVCLTIAEQLPQIVDRMTLVASDGLIPNYYYSFFIRTPVGKALFLHMLHNPAPYIRLVQWLKRRGLISDWQYKFVQHYTGDAHTRKMLSLRWPAMGPLVPSITRVKNNIRHNNIPLNLFMGKFDRVIPASSGAKFAQGLPSAQLHILDKGHTIIGPDTVHTIAQTLTK